MAGDIELGPLNSPVSVKPGELVELRTWRLVSNCCRNLSKRSWTYHFMDLLRHAVLQLRDVLLQRVHERLDVLLHLRRCEAQLSNRHANDTQPLPVLATTDHIPDGRANVCDDCARLGTWHQTPGTQHPSQSRLVQLLQRVDVADAPVELDVALQNLLEDLLLADECRTR